VLRDLSVIKSASGDAGTNPTAFGITGDRAAAAGDWILRGSGDQVVELPGQCDLQVCNARLGVAMQLAESIMVEPLPLAEAA